MKLPKGPEAPNLLQVMHWIADPVSYMTNAAKNYGDIFTARAVWGDGHLVFVSHPQAIQQILANDTKQFSAPGELNRILQPLLGDYSIIMLEGDRHRRERQLLMPPFHGDRLRTYGQLICNITRKMMDQLHLQQQFVARPVMQEISLQVILQAVFGLYEGERCQQLQHLLSSLLSLFGSPLTSSFLFFSFLQRDLGAWSPWGHFRRVQQQIDQVLYAEIAERRQQGDLNSQRSDILSLLMAARDEAGHAMTDQELRDELLTLLFAGHETTATAMAWSLYWVHHLPEVKDKLLQEVATLGPDPDPMSLARLPYLNAVCQETLRIYPVGMLTFPRTARSPVEIMGYSFDPGTILVGCIYLTHQRPDLYPEPEKFKPERFLERQFSPYEYLPFGGGSRRCIGMALAQLEMKLVLATILSHYSLALAEPRPVQPQRRGVTLAPATGVRMVLTEQRLPQAALARSL